MDYGGWSGKVDARHADTRTYALESYTHKALYSLPSFSKHTKIKKNTLIHPIFTSLPHSMSVISAWRVLTEQSNLGVEHLVMCAWRGSGEFSFAPVSLLICFCAAWPSLGKVSPLKAGPSTGRQRGKKKKKKRKRSISSAGFQAEIVAERAALIHSHRIIPNTQKSLTWVFLCAAESFHVLCLPFIDS